MKLERKKKKDKEWYEKNKDTVLARAKEVRTENTERNQSRDVYDETLKLCPACEGEKPRKKEYWSKNLDTKDGLYVYCKPCRSEKRRNSVKDCVNVLRGQAKRRGLEVPESFATYVAIMTQPCVYCGQFDKEDKCYGKFNGVDRVNTSQGYVKNNCVPCCWWCNTIKWKKTTEEMYEHLRKILQRRERWVNVDA